MPLFRGTRQSKTEESMSILEPLNLSEPEREINVGIRNGNISGVFRYKSIGAFIRDLVLVGSVLGWGSSYYAMSQAHDDLVAKMTECQVAEKQQKVLLDEYRQRIDKLEAKIEDMLPNARLGKARRYAGDGQHDER